MYPDAAISLEPPSLSLRQKLLRTGVAILVVSLFAWAYRGAEIRPLDLYQNRANMLEYARGFTTPDFSMWRFYLSEIVVTIHIALWGTALAVFGSVPLSLLASSNVSPFWVRQFVRRIMDSCRSINELVFAMLFVSAIGLGPFAGVLAIFVHNLGTLSKLFSEAVEAIDPGPLEGVRSTGADKTTEIFYGVLPQVLPLWTSYTLYRFESNVRAATVLGIIGAGGIGTPLHEAIRSFEYSNTAAILLIIIIAVVFIDLASSHIRKALM